MRRVAWILSKESLVAWQLLMKLGELSHAPTFLVMHITCLPPSARLKLANQSSAKESHHFSRRKCHLIIYQSMPLGLQERQPSQSRTIQHFIAIFKSLDATFRSEIKPGFPWTNDFQGKGNPG
jgi:hypothetical protein